MEVYERDVDTRDHLQSGIQALAQHMPRDLFSICIKKREDNQNKNKYSDKI